MIKSISLLSHLNASDSHRGMQEACKQFETIFAYQLLKVMGESVGEGFMGEGLSGDFYKDMLFMAVAENVADDDGLGIAEMLKNQIIAVQGDEGES